MTFFILMDFQHLSSYFADIINMAVDNYGYIC